MRKLKFFAVLFLFALQSVSFSSNQDKTDLLSCSDASLFFKIAQTNHIDLAFKSQSKLLLYTDKVSESVLDVLDNDKLLVLEKEEKEFFQHVFGEEIVVDLLHEKCNFAKFIGGIKYDLLERRLKLNIIALKSIKEDEIINAPNKYIKYSKRAESIEELHKRYKDLLLVRIKSLIAMGEDFDSIVKEIEDDFNKRKKILRDTTTEEQESGNIVFVLQSLLNAMDAMTSYIPHDAFSQLMEETAKGSFDGIGVSIEKEKNKKGISVKKVFKGGPSENILLPEDTIIEIEENGRVHDLRNLDIFKAIEFIRGPSGSEILITVQREVAGELELIKLFLRRDKIYFAESVEVELVSRENKNIAYIKFDQFLPKTATLMKKKIENATANIKVDGVVIDLRNNGGGLLNEAVKIADLFSDTGLVVYAKSSRNISPLRATVPGEIFKDVPMIVMINEYSASASEILAGYLQDINRALIVGSKASFGKGTIQNVIDPKSNMAGIFSSNKKIGGLKVTTGKFFTPSGRTPQKEGVPSDIVIPTLVPEDHMTNNSYLFTASYEELNSISNFDKYDYEYDKILSVLAFKSEERVKESLILQKIKNNPDSLLRGDLSERDMAEVAIKNEGIEIMLDTIKFLQTD